MIANYPNPGVLHSRLFQVIAAAVMAAIIIGLGYLGTRGRPPARNSPVEKLTIALPVLPHYALAHLAVVLGYFADEGLDVLVLPVSHGAAAVDSLLQGKSDLAMGGDVPFVISVMKGDDLGLIASLAVSNDNAIIARRDRAISAPRDLVGKKIGVTVNSSGSYYLWTFLISNRLAPDSVHMVDLPPGQLVEALASGSVDAGATWQPITFQARAALGKNALFLTETDAYKTTAVAMGRSEFLKAHPVAIKKLVRAMLKAEAFTRSHPDETLKLIAEWLKVTPDALRPVLKEFDFRVNLPQSQLVTLEDEARWVIAGGYVAKGTVPNFLPYLYMDALLAVDPERVTVLH